MARKRNKTKQSKNIKDKILSLLSRKAKESLNYKQIAAGLSMGNPSDRQKILEALLILKSQKKINEKERGKFSINQEANFVVGKADFTQSGSAYVILPDSENDVYISKNKTGVAFNGDTVRVRLRSTNKKNKPEGEIVEVVERKNTEFVGIYDTPAGKDFGFVVVRGQGAAKDFYIPKEKTLNAKNGEKVKIKFVDWPKGAESPFAEITEVLGDPNDSAVEMHAILWQYGLPVTFPEEIEEVAKELDTQISQSEIAKRRDMRKVPTFTIDPKDAKDFDDALSLQKLENGNWEVGVHIADVSHYVQPNTPLDNEAYQRATSVYLVDRVVPMLPEVLSNGVCSLRPQEEKLTFSGVFEMTDEAKIVATWFGRTVTFSDKRMAYEDAQAIIEGGSGEFKEEVLTLNRLAKTMRNARLSEGAISFDKSEVKFILDEQLNPTGIYLKESKEANHLIEEFMLLCNRKVSEFVSKNKKGNETKRTYVYRIHDLPDSEKLNDLRLYVKQFGYDVNFNQPSEIAQELNRLLKEVKGKPEAGMIETLTMRCMSKAKYTTENIGHYGLSFEHYSHFTSPIRRYPDVIAHRLLQHYLDGGASPSPTTYEAACEHCSDRERLAVEAERESIKYMQVKFMEDAVGEEYEGVITGVQDYGMFVEVISTRCEGMVRMRQMTRDRYQFDQRSKSWHGKESGKTYQLGDTVTIKVTKADLLKKQLDFELIG